MKATNSMNSKASEDMDDIQTGPLYLSYAERQSISTELIVPIDEEIKDPVYYRAVVERMSTCSEEDVVRFRINSPGGSLSGLLSLLYAIKDTEATCIAEIVGDCHSAASILALNCDSVHVSPYASMLVHYIQFNAGGKGADVRDMVAHTLSQSDRIFKETYSGFCSEDEIERIVEGKQLYLHSEEIAERLESKFEYMQANSEEDSEDLE